MAVVQKVTETASTDLAALLDAGDGAVVTLVAGDTRLVAHRAVLMDRSPVFAAMFAHDTLEASSGEVTIADVEGPVLRQLVSYLYTSRAPQLPDMAAQLLAAADKYGVSCLKAACEQQVATQLTVETAAATAVLAIRHSCADLSKAAVVFVKDNVDRVLGTQGWADAMLSQPQDLVQVSRLVSLTPSAEIRRLPAKEKERRLFGAAKEGAVEKLEALLAAGADVAARDGERETALHWAAAEGHVEAARRLLARGALVDARGSMDMTPLHWAVERGHEAVVCLLLAASADHGARDCQGWTPLHWAALNGNAEVAAALLLAGADKGATNNSGQTPLDVASEENHHQLVEVLSGS